MRRLRTIAADARKKSGWETFWLACAMTVTVLGSGYAIYALWPSALDAGKTVLNTIFLPTGNRPLAVLDGSKVSITWRANEGVDGQSMGYRITRVSAGVTTEVCRVRATTCRDIGVPAGTWRYTVRPDLGPWQGREGPPGAPVTVPTGPLPAAQDLAGPPGRSAAHR
jgi:hypothetical protein